MEENTQTTTWKVQNPGKSWDILQINWCMIFSINRINSISSTNMSNTPLGFLGCQGGARKSQRALGRRRILDMHHPGVLTRNVGGCWVCMRWGAWQIKQCGLDSHRSKRMSRPALVVPPHGWICCPWYSWLQLSQKKALELRFFTIWNQWKRRC